MKRRIWAALALAFVAMGPVACNEQPAQTVDGPEVPAGINVSNARLMLPAVAGNPAAVYVDVANNGDRDRMIRAASVEGAGITTMHVMEAGAMQETLQVMVKKGETVKFEPGGLHIMVNNLADTVKEGTPIQVTLTFVGGDEFSFPADVRAAGDDR